MIQGYSKEEFEKLLAFYEAFELLDADANSPYRLAEFEAAREAINSAQTKRTTVTNSSESDNCSDLVETVKDRIADPQVVDVELEDLEPVPDKQEQSDG